MFYKKESTHIMEAISVLNLNYLLLDENKDSFTLPVDGWYWFSTKEEAYKFLGADVENLFDGLIATDKGWTLTL